MSYDETDRSEKPVTAGDAPVPEGEVTAQDESPDKDTVMSEDQVPEGGAAEPTSDESPPEEHHAGGNPAAERAGVYAKPSEEEQAEIDSERERRLDPDNRPENAEVSNADAELPTVEAWNAEHADEDTAAGTSDPGQIFRDIEISEDEKTTIAQEREERLDPSNRPDGAEVDNTGKTFEDGEFVEE